MMSLIAKEWFMIPAVSFCVFIMVYLYSDRVLAYFQKKSLGQRDEIIRLLRLMYVDVNLKQVTMAMLLMSFGIGLLIFFLFLPNVILGGIVGSVVTIVGWSVPMAIVKYLYDQRCNRFVEQMVDGLTIMANGIKAQLAVVQTMERVVENLNGPIKQEFSLILEEIRLGRSLEESLVALSERIPKPDVQMFVTAIVILKETGGNLGETFTTIVTTIRERQKIEKKIQAMTAQGLMQGIIMTLVPIVLMIMFFIVDPGYIKPMFDKTLGLFLLLIMFSLQIIGGITIRKIVKIKV